MKSYGVTIQIKATYSFLLTFKMKFGRWSYRGYYMAARRYEISLRVLKKYFTRSLRSLVKYFSTLEEKFRISKRPCNVLFII